MTPPVVQRLLDYVAIKSLSREEGAITDRVAADLSAAGLRVARDGHNVWTEIGDADRPRLLFNSHLDTVPPGAGWDQDPWKPVLNNGRITGLGANDAKGCVVALIEAALRLKRRLDAGERLHGRVVLAFVAEEEITGGAGMEAALPRLGPIDAGIVGEPTGLTPMTAQRGLLILRCVARGRSGHPANTPADTPNNAIANAAADLMRLRDFDWGKPHPLLGKAHAHPTVISGGVARNVIPDACEFYVDIRTVPTESHLQLTQRLRAALDCEVHVHSDRLIAMDTPTDAAIVQAVIDARPQAKPGGSPAMSDMVFLAGTPSVKIGPGESPRSHTPNEYVLVSELEAGVNTYEQTALAYFRRMTERGK
ncbi:MAG: M20/M25/M40 family metallo-hydrolase [Phycisphaerales bacterium]|nr:M20/M25/M40 family metallo-hydrolase [Phycisphaerales bacterium]